MAGQPQASDVQSAYNGSSENAGEDALANLMESMEQFAAEGSVVNRNTDSEATEQKVEVRSSRRSQRTSATDAITDPIVLSPKTSKAVPAKRAQKNQSKPKTAKRAKTDIWT